MTALELVEKLEFASALMLQGTDADQVIFEDTPLLNRLLYQVEQLVNFNLKAGGLFSRTTAWDFLQNLKHCLPGTSEVLSTTLSTSGTPHGRARLLFRLGLNESALGAYFNAFSWKPDLCRKYYKPEAILRQAPHMQRVVTALNRVDALNFKLFIKDAKELDMTDHWAKVSLAPLIKNVAKQVSKNNKRKDKTPDIRSSDSNLAPQQQLQDSDFKDIPKRKRLSKRRIVDIESTSPTRVPKSPTEKDSTSPLKLSSSQAQQLLLSRVEELKLKIERAENKLSKSGGAREENNTSVSTVPSTGAETTMAVDSIEKTEDKTEDKPTEPEEKDETPPEEANPTTEVVTAPEPIEKEPEDVIEKEETKPIETSKISLREGMNMSMSSSISPESSQQELIEEPQQEQQEVPITQEVVTSEPATPEPVTPEPVVETPAQPEPEPEEPQPVEVVPTVENTDPVVEKIPEPAVEIDEPKQAEEVKNVVPPAIEQTEEPKQLEVQTTPVIDNNSQEPTISVSPNYSESITAASTTTLTSSDDNMSNADADAPQSTGNNFGVASSPQTINRSAPGSLWSDGSFELSRDLSRRRFLSDQRLSVSPRHSMTQSSSPAEVLSPGKENAEIQEHRPFWVQDDDVSQCMSQTCRRKFNIARRRHHCRNCGGVFCRHCCKQKRTIEKFGYIEPVLVCVDCALRLHKEAGAKGV